MLNWKRSWPEPPENLPVDVMPCSNGEFIPPPATQEQREIMRLARSESDRMARRLGIPRRDFLRTAAAFGVGFWAINTVRGTGFGHYALGHGSPGACDQILDEQGEVLQLNNMPGEFIFDIQTHHVDSGGTWRVTNPGTEAFLLLFFPQSSIIPRYGHSRGEVDNIEYLSQYYYLKELFLESATNVTVLSHAPGSPELNPLSLDKAAETVRLVNGLANSTRTVMHSFVMPNRGSYGTTNVESGPDPMFMAMEFAMMEEAAAKYPDILRAWKVYTPWGDVPYASGWFLDDRVGRAFVEKVLEVGEATGVPKMICLHKGFALPAFDQRAASPRDIGPIASEYWDRTTNDGVTLIVYHSGYAGGVEQALAGSGETIGPYPGDDWDSSDLGTDSLVKSLREHGWSARHFAPGGQPGVALSAGDGSPSAHANVPNVYAEIGGTWVSVFNDPIQAQHLLGKMIYYVGPKRVVWGTDSLWFGSPQSSIIAMRSLQMSTEVREMYHLPFGLDGDVEDPTQPAPSPERTIRNGILGRNAAGIYRIDVGATVNAISCDDVQKIRDAYLVNSAVPNPMQAAPMRSNAVPGYRTRRELFRELSSKPWAP